MENHIDILKKELKDKKDSEYKTLKTDVRDQQTVLENEKFRFFYHGR